MSKSSIIFIKSVIILLVALNILPYLAENWLNIYFVIFVVVVGYNLFTNIGRDKEKQ